MGWDKTNPAGATKIKDSDDEIRDNFAAIETVLGTNITAGPTTIQGAILGDATKGRNLRMTRLQIENGTNADTIKCTMAPAYGGTFNGDTVAAEDNLAKSGSTSSFSLDADGDTLTIKAAGVTGNFVGCFAILVQNNSQTDMCVASWEDSSDGVIQFRDVATGAVVDLTSLVDTGLIRVQLLYVTTA